ncbi:MAG: hypothetical protein JNL11_16950 [Bdellovibrionaceae bacterium]|nr:hypothetical protein [Pseudobdellovibrionaceae bacterium]
MKKKIIAFLLSSLFVMGPRPAKADMFGGDVVVLTQILAQAIQTVLTLKSVLENGKDTLNLMRDINSGVRSGLDLIRIINPNFNPGVYGNLKDADSVLRAIQAIYGNVPTGMDEDLMKSQDQSVAEVIAMNRNLYDYADQVDREREKILFHAQVVSPQGAGKLQNQAIGVLIGVTTQLLRTQSQMMKIMAQSLATENRREKMSTQNFQENYQDLSRGFGELPKETKLPRMRGEK